MACNSPTSALTPGTQKSESTAGDPSTIRPQTAEETSGQNGELSPGTPAPDVALTLHYGKQLRLSELRGKRVVLFFYPMDDTPGCRAEAQGFRDHFDQFQDRDAVILGVSLQGAESHKAFIEKERLPYDLVVDDRALVSEAFGVPVHGHVTARQTFLVNENGAISHVWRKVAPRTHATQVLAALSQE
jgi:thioredoxin-dependent peroxiredoxin